jgi:cytoskeletal protein CcmA (bactofilin family)
VQLTLIPRGTRVDGLVETAGDLTVEGRMDGRIEIGGVLVVAAGATCRSSVRAREARIAGEVMGDVVCSAAIEVLPGGRVVGDLRAPEVEVDAEAFVDGRVDLLPPQPEAIEVQRTRVSARGPGVSRPSPPPPVTQVGPATGPVTGPGSGRPLRR